MFIYLLSYWPLPQHHLGQVQQDKKEYSEEDVSQLWVGWYLIFCIWWYLIFDIDIEEDVSQLRVSSRCLVDFIWWIGFDTDSVDMVCEILVASLDWLYCWPCRKSFRLICWPCRKGPFTRMGQHRCRLEDILWDEGSNPIIVWKCAYVEFFSLTKWIFSRKG